LEGFNSDVRNAWAKMWDPNSASQLALWRKNLYLDRLESK
jgi:hypothetical protein